MPVIHNRLGAAAQHRGKEYIHPGPDAHQVTFFDCDDSNVS
jgi:hypothetical protein